MFKELDYKNFIDIQFLRNFLSNQIPSSFRYFNNRDIYCIKNHIVTVLYIIDNKPVAYGHLDQDNVIWLGICVIPGYQGKSIGTKIMNYLLKFAEKECIDKIFLTVDKDNIPAINLYKKFGFEVEYDSKIYLKMNKKIILKE